MGKKIAIFTDSFVPGVGGTENAVLRYATELSENNEVLVVAPFFKKGFDDGRFPFKVIRTKSLKVTANDRWTLPLRNGFVIKKVREFAPDIVHCQTLGQTAKLGNRYAKKYGVPLVYTVHTKYRYCYKQSLKSSFLAEIVLKSVVKCVRPADAVCTVSGSMIEELKSYGIKQEVTVIRNGFKKSDAVYKPKSENEKFTMLYVGYVIAYKNLALTFDALKILKKTYPDFVFYVVGKGPQEKYFKKYALKAGLKEEVVFTGVITDRAALNDMYVKADLLVFPSVFDNDSMTIIEAACAGTPSLVTAGTGSAERITDGVNGFTAAGSPQAFADKMLEIIRDKGKLKAAGENAASILNTWRDTVLKYDRVYEELLNAKK